MGWVGWFWLYSTGGFGLNSNFDCFRMGVGGFRFDWEDWLVLVCGWGCLFVCGVVLLVGNSGLRGLVGVIGWFSFWIFNGLWGGCSVSGWFRGMVGWFVVGLGVMYDGTLVTLGHGGLASVNLCFSSKIASIELTFLFSPLLGVDMVFFVVICTTLFVFLFSTDGFAERAEFFKDGIGSGTFSPLLTFATLFWAEEADWFAECAWSGPWTGAWWTSGPPGPACRSSEVTRTLAKDFGYISRRCSWFCPSENFLIIIDIFLFIPFLFAPLSCFSSSCLGSGSGRFLLTFSTSFFSGFVASLLGSSSFSSFLGASWQAWSSWTSRLLGSGSWSSRLLIFFVSLSTKLCLVSDTDLLASWQTWPSCGSWFGLGSSWILVFFVSWQVLWL